MGFPAALTSDNYTDLRGNNRGQSFAAFNPSTVIFAARVNQSVFAATFAQVTFDTVTVGSIAAALEGYTVYFSATNDISAAYHTGRVRLGVASGTTLYIDETSAAISNNDYIFATKDVRLWHKQPRLLNEDYFKDYSITYRELLPVIQSLSTAQITVASTAWDFVFAPTAVAIESGATIVSWSWFADGGTFQSGSSSSQNVTIRYSSAGHYMPRVTVTDSNGNTNWFAIQCFAVPSDYSSVVTLDTKDYQISGNGSVGYSASIVGWVNVSPLAQTFVVIFRLTNTNINGNIRFVGRTRSYNAQTVIESKRSLVSTNALQIEGIGGQLGNTKCFRMGFTDVDAPTRFDEINDLTWWRAASYLITEHSTLANICAVGFSDSGNTYQFGAYSSQKGSLADSLNDSIGFTIKASLNYAADGTLYMARDANYLPVAARNALTTVANFTTSDYLEYTLSLETQPQTGQIVSFGGVYAPLGGELTLYRAIAPAVTATVAQGEDEFNRQVLAADSDVSTASAELGERAANDLAAKNPTLTLRVTHPAGYDFVTPTRFQWYTWTLPAISNAQGVLLTTAQRFLCVDVTMSYDHETASVVNEATYQLETRGVGYQIIAGLAPIDQPMSLPSLPILDPYPTFPAEELIFAPEGSTDEADQQPVSNRQGAVIQSPLTPKSSWSRNNPSDCMELAVNFQNPVNVGSPKLTQNGGVYAMTLSGFSSYAASGWEQTFDFAINNGGWEKQDASVLNIGTYDGGVGAWRSQFANIAPNGNASRLYLQITFTSAFITNVSVTHQRPSSTNGLREIWTELASAITVHYNEVNNTDYPAGSVLSTPVNETADKVIVRMNASPTNVDIRYTQIVISGTGTNPFTASPGIGLSCDAFYIYATDESDPYVPQLYSTDEGLRLQNAPVDPVDIPDYNPSHTYEIPFTGDGNQLLARMQFNDYGDKDNKNLNIELCL